MHPGHEKAVHGGIEADIVFEEQGLAADFFPPEMTSRLVPFARLGELRMLAEPIKKRIVANLDHASE
ncbi:hypothetical protein EBQ81_01015 [bacterium]|nr:hypothetical protein [bacterium]